MRILCRQVPARLVASAALGCVLLAGCSGSDDDPDAGASTPVGTDAPETPSGAASSPATSAPPTATPAPDLQSLDAPGTPVGLAAVGDVVWVVNAESGTIDQVEGETSVEIGDVPLRAVATPGGIWVSVFGSGEIALVDPEAGTVVTRADLAVGDVDEPEGMAYRDGAIWVVDQAADEVVEADAVTGEVRRRVAVGDGPRLVHAGTDAVYVTSYLDGTITRVDPASGEASTSEDVCLGPQGVTEARGLVWVSCTVSDEVVALDPTTLAEVGRVGDLEDADPLVATRDGDLLVILSAGPTVVHVDTETITETTRSSLGDSPAVTTANVDAIAVGDRLFVSNPVEGVVLAVPLIGVGVDPAT